MLAVCSHEIRATWTAFLLWILAFSGLLVAYGSFYPLLGTGPGMQELIQQLPADMVEALGYDAIASGAGWTHSTFFGLLGLFLICAAGIVWGTRALASEEDSGRLEMTLAHGISRLNYYGQQLLMLLLRFLVIGVITSCVLLGLNEGAQLRVDIALIPAEVVAWLALGFFFAALSIGLGAVGIRAQIAQALAVGVLLLSYLADALGKAVTDYEWLRYCSPISWVYRSIPLQDGWPFAGIVLLLGCSLCFIGVGGVVFRSRDIR
ncbi:ABC transporter permease subunit [Schaalia suimastitidis]|uniref:ABC transporter permease subunit n=1 Tax=Schaalia suimastitidis TaxID=121163 RepID=UPI000422C813|nr:ABC transporter permease subunit [Schaalia suimastitidis]